MTKNKKFTYGLLACVGLIWSIVFYKVYAAMAQDEEPVAITNTSKTLAVKHINHENDRVQLDLDYLNPFAYSPDDVVATVATAPVKTTNAILSGQQVKPKVNWSAILYSGYINNPSNRKKIGIISINGTALMLAEGQSSNGLKLLKLTNDSVQLVYQKEIRYIKLK